MKTTQQEIINAISANAGNRLTPELIAGLQVRINHIFTNAEQQKPTEKAQSKE